MKKQTKAAAAAGAGAILLLGGAGSLAYWNDSSSTPDAAISSGTLSLDDCTGDGTWTDVNHGGTTITDIDAFRIVPGDVVSYTCETAVNATGDNLTATLTADVGGVTGDQELEDALNPPVVSVTANGVELPSDDSGVQITPAALDADQPIVVSVTMTFDPLTDGTTAQTQTVNLAATQLVLTQNTNPTP
ncbi:alternate-type signal peptide domain-containing protein [Williamsia muralis]|uniref:Alternate-type signal peptide domain-containing protein n=1 Tax=Williamsia marianensis TaxID=85044 RepID=A0ABU4ERE7_WILMA|nr:alternate-type signal peptide domain-containing protein [Williamsia muralis]MDV7133197.1 alternate-type signal peptide domain-containing protein [Williamsia muralis]